MHHWTMVYALSIAAILFKPCIRMHIHGNSSSPRHFFWVYPAIIQAMPPVEPRHGLSKALPHYACSENQHWEGNET